MKKRNARKRQYAAWLRREVMRRPDSVLPRSIEKFLDKQNAKEYARL